MSTITMVFQDRDIYYLNMSLWRELDRIEASYSYKDNYKEDEAWQSIARLLNVSYKSTQDWIAAIEEE